MKTDINNTVCLSSNQLTSRTRNTILKKRSGIERTLKTIVISGLSLFSSLLFADDEGYYENKSCTKAAIAASEAYDPGSSELLECIRVRDDFKVVMAWNNKSINGKILATKGENVGQQVVNARNLVRDYENNYGMMHMSEYEMVVVAYAGGVDWLRTSNDQEDINMVNGLLNKGVKIYACQNTMKSKGIVIGDLIPGVRIVPAGVSAVIDFANRRYNYLNP